jgi:uncharacterized protein
MLGDLFFNGYLLDVPEIPAKMTEPLVLYHGDPDGFTSAAIALQQMPDATLVQVDYGLVSVGVVGDGASVIHVKGDNNSLSSYPICGRDIYFLDYHLGANDTTSLLADANSVHIFDHHKSSVFLEDLQADNLFVHRDMSKAACALTWRHFFPGIETPWLVSYVQDRDLWTKQLPYTNEINAYLITIGQTIEAWEEHLQAPMTQKMQSIGRGVLMSEKALVTLVIQETLRWVDFMGHTVPCACSSILRSEIGHVLAEMGSAEFGIVYFPRACGDYKVSLRSNGFDVSKLAASFPGGGGHNNAAGFEVKELPF